MGRLPVGTVDCPGPAREKQSRAFSGQRGMREQRSVSDHEAALRAVERGWNAAARDWNPAGLAALYTEDAVFYGGRPGHSVGRQQVSAYFESYVGMFTHVGLALIDQELRALGDDVCLAQGYARFSIDLAAGGTTTAVLRSTLVLVRRPEGWLIAQHHFSATPDTVPIPLPDAKQA